MPGDVLHQTNRMSGSLLLHLPHLLPGLVVGVEPQDAIQVERSVIST